ncbi:MAG: hypothetical protein NTZ65_03135 [Candidatus Berkelbacteria bacterium]|nr:hypothetical protein [Candidatus Berkelbacteria bacterium]
MLRKFQDEGTCPGCEHRTQIYLVESDSVPGEQQTWTEEKCTGCGFAIESDRTSTNPTTMQSWAVTEDLRRERVQSAMGILPFLREQQKLEEFDAEDVRQAVTRPARNDFPLTKQEFSYLYIALKERECEEEAAGRTSQCVRIAQIRAALIQIEAEWK